MIKSSENSIGAKAFLLGVILAIIIGVLASIIPLFSTTQYSKIVYFILIVLGIIVGASINTSGRDSQTFLITGAVIVIVSKFGMESVISSLIGIGAWNMASSIFGALLTLFVPATIMVAIKTVFGLSRV
jgi:hypothetical protein